MEQNGLLTQHFASDRRLLAQPQPGQLSLWHPNTLPCPHPHHKTLVHTQPYMREELLARVEAQLRCKTDNLWLSAIRSTGEGHAGSRTSMSDRGELVRPKHGGGGRRGRDGANSAVLKLLQSILVRLAMSGEVGCLCPIGDRPQPPARPREARESPQ